MRLSDAMSSGAWKGTAVLAMMVDCSRWSARRWKGVGSGVANDGRDWVVKCCFKSWMRVD